MDLSLLKSVCQRTEGVGQCLYVAGVAMVMEDLLLSNFAKMVNQRIHYSRGIAGVRKAFGGCPLPKVCTCTTATGRRLAVFTHRNLQNGSLAYGRNKHTVFEAPQFPLSELSKSMQEPDWGGCTAFEADGNGFGDSWFKSATRV